MSQRSAILVDAIELLKNHPAIARARVDVWGVGQAGYVIPLALTMTDDISFIIEVGVASVDGIEQAAYFITSFHPKPAV